MTLAPLVEPADDVLGAYVEHSERFPIKNEARQQLIRAAIAFHTDHRDLGTWMARPVDARMVDLSRRIGSWPFVFFVLLSGRCRADLDFLFAKNFGHSGRRTTSILYPDDIAALHEAAERLGESEQSFTDLVGGVIPLAIAHFGVPPSGLSVEDLETLVSFTETSPRLTTAMRHSRHAQLFRLRQLLFQAGMTDDAPQRRREGGPATRAQRLMAVPSPGIRNTILSYLEARSAVVRPKTLDKLTSALAIFGEFIGEHFPELASLSQLDRHHVEAFLTWTATRPGRRAQDAGKPVGPFVPAHAAFTLRNFLDDIAAWGWAEAPQRRLVFSTDIPRQPEILPRGLPPDVDAALMEAVRGLDDVFARTAITVLRHTGLRRGELLDLELDCVTDYGPSGLWLRVPIGKLHDERAVPLDDTAIGAIDEWLARRAVQRAIPHQRDGRMCDFVFMERGRHLGPTRIERGLRDAVRIAGIVGTDGAPRKVVAHQLRHTWASELVNAGMSLQALMALLGHRTPEMTIRYARLSSPTLRSAYDQALGKVAPRIPVAPAGLPAVPDRVSWLSAEMLKTRVAHGYCARELAAEACPYANVCETCPNFVTTLEFAPALEAQLDDVRVLRDDAERRGWGSEVSRHDRVIVSLGGVHPLV
ncbi:MAG: tyrosine-type recombinase/integrase [Actinomycetota bacterium]|jgi:integrase|nr:tyrosine-type recombinase/integrase [Actinomycetota bacterium]